MVLDRFYKVYGLEEISSATDNFSKENLITEGAFGKVYKGRLLRYGHLMDFVVRRLDCEYGQGDEMQMEISMLKSLDHKNIVSIFGHCDENNEKMIIYGHSIQGTLDQHLSDSTLKWSKTLRICLGVAKALNYLHYDVIHCDINSSKVFLDKDWEPKIYGFELSTKYPQSWKHRLLFSNYFDTNNMTPKYDVCKFGELLREVLHGRKSMITNDGVLEELDKLIDPSSRTQMDTELLKRFEHLAKICSNEEHLQRPTMYHIVKELEELLELQCEHENANIEHPIANEGTSSCNLKDYLKIPLSEIKLATDNFSVAKRVGCGGYADVYKAELNVVDSQCLPSILEGKCKEERPMIKKTVAIKRINKRAYEQGEEVFSREIELLSRCKHRNIISLLGFSSENGELILVFEYALKGSLSDYLRWNNNPTWAQRLQICLDIAHGINYLHTNIEGKPRIIHRDIKSDNILLDESLNAKVADFGLSIFHPMKQQASTVYTKMLVGTEVYLDPEYSDKFKYKRAIDVYSFGVVLFEVLCGRVAYDSIYMHENEKGLAPIARRRFTEGTLKELIDPKIIEEDDAHTFTLNRGPNQDSFDAFSKIAFNCLAETQNSRPTMEVVIKELQNALNLQGETMVLRRFRHSDIESATKEFAKTCCIGLGTNGMVYKAVLDHFGNNGGSSKKHINVAVKRINGGKSKQGKQAFLAELEMCASYKHPNVISLLGFSDEGADLILVYEHAFERSLDDCLKSVDGMNNLTWTNRLHMCLQIARGLNHLHTKMDTLHGDINSANILLDKNSKKAKIVYTGISNPTNQDVCMRVYWDPEPETKGELGRKSDIYSFGVVLFEIFCGKVAYDPRYINENDKGLACIARQCFCDETTNIIIDPKLKEESDEDIFSSNRGPNRDSLKAFLEIAHLCLEEAAKRPTMETVIKELGRALNFHEAPKKLQISLKDIVSATTNFSEKNCIGSGRFWKAYKGELPFLQDNANTSGRITIVAKRWDSKFGLADQQFRTEFNILFNCQHENVIRCEGYCNEKDEKIIIYQYMSNGSLDKHLKEAHLKWMKRLEICIDVASGLDFLHQGGVKEKKVVHRDIKSSSILLHDDWKAKISNLELSSLHQDMEYVSDNAYATFNYLDPQYKQGLLTEKSDIYSFGVVLFEILCGRLAWVEDCEDHSQSLGPLAKMFDKEGKLDDIVFEGIREQIGPESLDTFADIAHQCLHDKSEERPTAREVVIQLKKALDLQNDYEMWETQLPEDYKEIIQMSKNPEIYSTAKRKDIYDTLSKGILIQDGKVWFSLGSNGERNKMVSASEFSYENHSSQSHSWLYMPESRFDKIAKMSDISNLNIQIKIKSHLLSIGVNYGVHLVFKFNGARKPGTKPVFVNLTYKMGNETLHAYFAAWREDNWMTIEFYRFLNHKESDTANFEFLLESVSQIYYGSELYVEGVEFRAIDNVKPEENNLMEVEQSTTNMDPVPHTETNNIPFDICSIFTQNLLKLLSWRNKEEQYYMLSANEAFCDSFNANLFNLKPSTESMFQKVAELLSTQVFRIKCKIKSKRLLQNTDYSCYLVFKLSKSCGLHCPVKVYDLHQSTNNHTKVVYFSPQRPWNIDNIDQVPREREDEWMEVHVWNFKSNFELQYDCINLDFRSCEGTMSGLIVRGLEFRPT
ncbi:putative protein kinase RLK-Pelle-CrRLK1L-1 family [Helianthus debilis subsp. tardiflorus]